jgi:ABC-type transport system involved in multi-copper enzyme maturation permease subunit
LLFSAWCLHLHVVFAKDVSFLVRILTGNKLFLTMLVKFGDWELIMAVRQHVTQFAAIARITASEALRQPICLLLAGASVLAVLLLPFVLTHQFGEAGRLVRDSALSLHLVAGLLLSMFLAVSVYRSEMQSGTAGIILCKPVMRALFFMAKFAGVGGVLLLYSLCMMCSTLLASLAARERFVIDWGAQFPLLCAFLGALLVAGVINYVTGRSFSALALKLLVVLLAVAVGVAAVRCSGPGVAWRFAAIFQAGTLITVAVLVLAALTSALAPRCGAAATVVLCSVLFAAGLVMDYLYGLYAGDSLLVQALFYGVPNWQRFWVADAVSGGKTLPVRYFAGAVVYGVLYLTGALCGGMLLFRRVEVGR